MTTASNVVLYYATLNSVVPQKTAYTTDKKRQSNNNKNKKTESTNAATPTPKALPVLELGGEEYIDTHTHVDSIFKKFKLPLTQWPAFSKTYFQPGFGGCITVCCSPDSIEPVTRLLPYEGIHAAFGVHPHNAKDYSDGLEKRIEDMMSHPKTVAWGECGLDYFYSFSEPELQRTVFTRQVQKAVQHKKPLVIHTREAEEDTLQIMEQHLPKDWPVHVHCFTSSVQMAKQLLERWSNLVIGFTGVITFQSTESVRDVVRLVPLDRFLLETDGPFMAPLPFRGEVCHSGHVPFIAKMVSQVKDVPLKEVLAAARANTRRVYGI
ncbi:Metallo-dependent hydrolase [Balamuthia mandrillaris]